MTDRKNWKPEVFFIPYFRRTLSSEPKSLSFRAQMRVAAAGPRSQKRLMGRCWAWNELASSAEKGNQWHNLGGLTSSTRRSKKRFSGLRKRSPFYSRPTTKSAISGRKSPWDYLAALTTASRTTSTPNYANPSEDSTSSSTMNSPTSSQHSKKASSLKSSKQPNRNSKPAQKLTRNLHSFAMVLMGLCRYQEPTFQL